MRISTRLLLLFIVIAFAFGAFFYLFYHIKQEELRLYIEGDLYQRRLTIDAFFQMKADAQANMVEDYSIWDKMVDFIQAGDLQWARRNLDSIIPIFGYSLVQVYDSNGNLIYNDVSETAFGLSEYRMEIPLVDSLNTRTKQSYHTRFNNHIMSCAVATIHPTDDSNRSGLPQGYFLLGQLYDYNYLNSLAKALNYDIRIALSNPGEQQQSDHYNTRIMRVINDLGGSAIAWITFYSSNPFLATLRSLGNLILFGTIGFIFIFLLMQYFLIQQWISAPMGLISQALKRGDPKLIEPLSDTGNEFADVAGLIERFFLQKDELLQEINERSKTEAKLREMEEQTRKILLTSPESIIVTELDGSFLSVNDETLRLLKAESSNGLLERYLKFSEIVHHTERKQFLKMLQDLFKGVYIRNQELRVHRVDGSLFSALVSASVIMDEANNPTKLIFITRDLTDLKNLENKLRQSQKMESLGTLAGGIAHDFNNIITIIAGYISLSSAKLDQPELAQRDLDEAIKACLRAGSLIGKILAFSRQSGFDVGQIVFADIIEESLPMIRAALPARIHIETTINSRACTLADSSSLSQVIINLASNASHAMNAEGGTLSINLDEVNGFELIGIDPKVALESSYLRLKVSDTGCGIPAAIISRIFDPYFSTRSYGEGTGLGLSIVHGIVTGYKGFITVQSVVDRGATFNVFLPAIEQEKIIRKPVIEPVVPFIEARIMIVDDEPDLAAIFLEALQKAGYTVVSFSDSQLAHRQFSQSPESYDLVIADINMPGMDGIKLASAMKALKSIPIILYTGFLDKVLQDRVEEAHISYVLHKPIMPDDMVNQVRRILYQEQGA
jgi:PAS domain S-box-containing protein